MRCTEKDLVGCAPLSPPYGVYRSFSWFEGVPKDHEELLQKGRPQGARLRGSEGNFSWFQGYPKEHEKLYRKDLMGFASLHPSYDFS
jgi:hypothetical protein